MNIQLHLMHWAIYFSDLLNILLEARGPYAAQIFCKFQGHFAAYYWFLSFFFFHQNSPNASRTIQNPSRTPQPPQSHKNSPKTLQPQIPIFTKKVGKVILGGIPGNWGLQGGIWGSQWGRGVGTLFLSFLTLRSPTKTPPKPKFWWKRKGGAVTQGGFWGGLEFRAAFGGSRRQKEDIAVWQLGQQWKSWTHDFQTLVLGCTRLKLNFFSFNLEYFFHLEGILSKINLNQTTLRSKSCLVQSGQICCSVN